MGAVQQDSPHEIAEAFAAARLIHVKQALSLPATWIA
jgi:hypothetical protein